MIGTAGPVETRPPHHRREHGHGKKEKDSHHFEPQDSAHAAKGFQKSAHPAGCPPRHFSGGFAGGACGFWIKLAHRYTGWVGAGLRAWALRARSLRARGNPLPGHASGHAESDAEGASDSLRFHFVLMVTAAATVLHFTGWASSRLLSGGVGSKVEESQAATGAHFCAGRRS